MARPSPPRRFERSYLSENWGRVRWYGVWLYLSWIFPLRRCIKIKREMVTHHTDFLDFHHKYFAARSVFKALCGVCENWRNFKEISTNLCLVLFPYTSLQNKQNTHWLRLFSQDVVIYDKIRRWEINLLFTSYQLAKPRIHGKSSRNYLRAAFKDSTLLVACIHYRPNCKKINGAIFWRHLSNFRSEILNCVA